MSNITDHPLYSRWHMIKVRCDNPNHKSYINYGGRGITICQGFRNFNHFLSLVGLPPFEQAQIDRINNDGHYSCGSCAECENKGWYLNLRWATPKQNANNRRARIDTAFAYYDGELFDVGHLAKCLGLKKSDVSKVLLRKNNQLVLTNDGMKKLAAML